MKKVGVANPTGHFRRGSVLLSFEVGNGSRLYWGLDFGL